MPPACHRPDGKSISRTPHDERACGRAATCPRQMKSPAWGRGAHRYRRRWVGWRGRRRERHHGKGTRQRTIIRSRATNCRPTASDPFAARLRGSAIFLLYRFHTGARWGYYMEGGTQKSRVIKRSIVFAGHKTSVSLEDQFWAALREISTAQGVTTGALVASINAGRQHDNLSSAIRVFVLNHYRAQADARRSAKGPNEEGHPVRSGRP
jgi:predicted DNA-binding ribbon-helix-helix protein